MRFNLDTQRFALFSFVTQKDLYAAIPRSYLSVIDQSLSEFGFFENIPADRTVRGIFLKYNGNDEFSLEENSPMLDLTINQLRHV